MGLGLSGTGRGLVLTERSALRDRPQARRSKRARRNIDTASMEERLDRLCTEFHQLDREKVGIHADLAIPRGCDVIVSAAV